MSDERPMDVPEGGKGTAFLRYHYIDRGGEKDLTLEESMSDFENYIYGPISHYVMSEYVTDASMTAVEAILGDGEPRPLSKEETHAAALEIGLAVLAAFVAMTKQPDDD